MATRHSRKPRGQRPRRRWLRLLAAVAIACGLLWAVPIVLVETPLRDVPLRGAFAGIDGRLSSGGAAWNWLGPIEYRAVTLADPTGRAVAGVPRLSIERGLVGLALGWLRGGPIDLGTVRIIGAEVLVEVRPGGSGIEDILAPWLAAAARPANRPEATTRDGGVCCDLEVIDGAIELVDLARDDSWRITDLLAAIPIGPAAGASAARPGWTAAGRAQQGGRPSAAVGMRNEATAADPARFDRTTITAGATAALARVGGWSVSSPARPAADAPATLAVAANRLPLGVSSAAATRFMTDHLLDGLADVRLDITLPLVGAVVVPADTDGGPMPDGAAAVRPLAVMGAVTVSQLAVRSAATLEPLAAVERCEVPLDVVVHGDTVTIRDLRAISPLFKAEASGRVRLPAGDPWAWGESLVGENFAVAADIDLAAAARAIPGGLQVRPDVKVTGGQLQVTAAARPDGKDRVLEVRATSRDLAAEQHAVDGMRPLRWNEPFTAWLRGRRGAARGDRFRVEEARVASPAVEVAAAGTAESLSAQWTIDIGTLVREAAEVLDVGTLAVRGTARGSVELSRAAGTKTSSARLSAAFTDVAVAAPGRREWSDKEITIEAEGEGSRAGAAWLVDSAEARIAADGDRIEATLAGGAIVDPRAIMRFLAGSGSASTPWLRTAPDADAASLDCSVSGDLARWQARLEAIAGGAAPVAIDGRLEATAAVTARGHAWQITRATAEIEKLVATPAVGAWRIEEPRLVATAAGLVDPGEGLLEVSSAELLTATLSLRTGGTRLAFPAAGGSFVDRVRGKVQWQADVSRLEKWLLPAATVARWPAAGRAWGTAELLDTPAGANLLVEITGNQLAVARAVGGTPLAGGASPPQPVWMEPRVACVLEVTKPVAAAGQVADGLSIDRLAIDSSTLAVAASGRVSEAGDVPMMELGGTISYDWSQVSRLLTPWTGGGVQLVGGGPRPFAIRGPLGARAELAGSPATEGRPPATVPVPESWLEGAGGDGPRAHTITLPVPAARRTAGIDRLREVSIDTSTTWTGADLGGLRIDAGEMAVRLFEGQLAFGPFDIGSGGGRLRGAPWIKLLPLPGELVVPPGRLVEHVALTPEMCNQWVRWVVPLLGRSTNTEGLVSIDVAGGRIPLGDPFGGEMGGQIVFDRLETTPGGAAQPLVNLIVKLQSVIDPRFAFGDKTVLMRVRPDPVRVQLAQRRLLHEGLVMDTGQLTVRTKGSVAADGALDMTVELALRGDIAGQTPVIATLLRTPLVIPLKGTVHHPQFDAGRIDAILGRIVENTAEAVISDGLSRGLEALFGK